MKLKPFLTIVGIAALYTLGAATSQGSDKVVFSAAGSGYAFDRPKAWKAVVTRKESKLFIPTPSAQGAAEMNFYDIQFRGPIDDWQQAQAQLAKDLGRAMVMQWQEVFLGVPLLLSKSTYVKDGVNRTSLTGLLYSAALNKMLFRLDVASDGFDDADAAWRSAFLTLRTTDGSKPQVDDPDKKLTPAELKPKPSIPMPVTHLGDTGPKKFSLGSVLVPGAAGGSKVQIHLIKGWSAEAQSPTTSQTAWTLKCADLPGGVSMTLNSTLDSDPAQKALFRSATAMLDQYQEVKERTEVTSKLNTAGGKVNSIWRVGKSAKGALSSCEATVEAGDFYILIEYRVDGVLTAAQRRILDSMLLGTTIVPQPS